MYSYAQEVIWLDRFFYIFLFIFLTIKENRLEPGIPPRIVGLQAQYNQGSQQIFQSICVGGKKLRFGHCVFQKQNLSCVVLDLA